MFSIDFPVYYGSSENSTLLIYKFPLPGYVFKKKKKKISFILRLSPLLNDLLIGTYPFTPTSDPAVHLTAQKHPLYPSNR